MNLILLSGGSGKRLWPLSNETRSKQFLKLLRNDRNEPESMVQRVFRQIGEAGLDARIVVATGESQVDALRGQLGEAVDVVVEPERRDTFAAIALATAHLALRRGLGPDETVVVLPVDPYAELSYFTVLRDLERLVRDGAANLALMGVRPTYPSSKYGYVVPTTAAPGPPATPAASDAPASPDGPRRFFVDFFQEKPTEEVAAGLIRRGALWNGGVFAFRLGYLLDIVRRHVAFDTFEELLDAYSSLPKRSFDYEVVEREPSIAGVEYVGTWKDLGTWNTLTEVMGRTASGNVQIDACANTHVINELPIPVIVLGTHDLVVAASPNGILVSDKLATVHMKPFVDKVDPRPMYAERPWGTYTVLEFTAYPGRSLSLAQHLSIIAGARLDYQSHAVRDEILTFVDGEGFLVLGGEVRPVRGGDHAFVAKGTRHALHAVTDLHVIEVQVGETLDEGDTERFDWNWPEP
jgi:mannose-1-phosphate guanylyltransferase